MKIVLHLLLIIIFTTISTSAFPYIPNASSRLLDSKDSGSFKSVKQSQNSEAKTQEWFGKDKMIFEASQRSASSVQRSTENIHYSQLNNKRLSIQIYKQVAKQINEIMKQAVEIDNMPGTAISICVRGIQIFFGGLVNSNLSTHERMNPNYKYRIASQTKTFTATVTLQLVDEGKLSLDDKLSKFVPSVPNADKITIRQLLNMTSGVYNYTNDPYFIQQLVTNPLRKWAPEEFVNIAISHGPDFLPGTNYYYSNTNYILLGMIIEQITGNTVENEITDRIIEPLQLNNTSFPTTPYINGNYMHGYRINNENLQQDTTFIDPSAAWSAGGIVSTLDDLSVWVKALAEGSLISESSHQEQLTLIPKENYGLGIMYGDGYYGHSGSIPGFNGIMMYNPEHDVTIVDVTNQEPGGVADNLFVEIERYIKSINYLE